MNLLDKCEGEYECEGEYWKTNPMGSQLTIMTQVRAWHYSVSSMKASAQSSTVIKKC